MELDNGIHLIIHKSFYNKTKVQKDGVTHIVDTEHSYPLYQLNLTKNYFTLTDKEQVIDEVIKDLESTAKQLKQLKRTKQQDKTNDLIF